MEMSNELREIFKKSYAENAKICCKCNHKCFLYLLVTYIDSNGFEFFQYQLDHDTLPTEINIAYSKFLNLYESILFPNAVSIITPPWC